MKMSERIQIALLYNVLGIRFIHEHRVRDSKEPAAVSQDQNLEQRQVARADPTNDFKIRKIVRRQRVIS
jgi:hypothetical protein